MITILNASSQKDRISFFSYKNGITAIQDKNKKIRFELSNSNANNTLSNFFILYVIIALIRLFVLIPLISSNNLCKFFYLIPTFIYIIIMISRIIKLRVKYGIEGLRNHAAEHMVFNAYNNLKRVPTIEEAKTFSRFSKSCGISIYSAFIVSQFVAFIFYLFFDYIIPELLLYMLPCFLYSYFPFNLIGLLAQHFTTDKPKNKNIKLAISALLCLELLDTNKNEALSYISNDNIKLNIK